MHTLIQTETRRGNRMGLVLFELCVMETEVKGGVSSRYDAFPVLSVCRYTVVSEAGLARGVIRLSPSDWDSHIPLCTVCLIKSVTLGTLSVLKCLSGTLSCGPSVQCALHKRFHHHLKSQRFWYYCANSKIIDVNCINSAILSFANNSWFSF